MMVKECDKVSQMPSGGVGVCLNVCVCPGFIEDFEFWEGGNSKVRC